MKNYDSFIFDLDGTICDTLLDICNSVNYALKYHHLPTHSLQEYKTFVGNGSKKLIERAIYPKIELFDEVFHTYMNKYLSNPTKFTKPYPNIKKLLRIAKKQNIKLFVYTNKPQVLADKVIDKCFKDTFDLVVGVSSNKEKIKPYPDLFLSKTQSYNIDYLNSVYFGDSDVDILTANNLNIKHIYALTWGYQSLKQLKAIKCNNVNYINDINGFISNFVN